MLDQKIIDIFNMRVRTGDYGLELEVEGRNLPRTGLNPYWLYHEDGSLRGESAEYVLQSPQSIDLCNEALVNLDKMFTKMGSEFNLSSRTSVHVHMNCQRAILQEVYNIICIEFILDNLLVEYSGPDRIGNLFCLRAQDAEYLPLSLANGLRNGTYLNFLNDNIRYASMNLLALQAYGSIEFRSFRGSVSRTEIMSWMTIIDSIKKTAKKHNDPRSIIKLLYDSGPKAFLDSIFTPEQVEIFTSFRNWRTSMERGSHYAFEIAYATNDWKDKEDVYKKYKDRKKLRPGECEDIATDPRFVGQEPEVAEQFLQYERDMGRIVTINDRDFDAYMREAIRHIEQRRQHAIDVEMRRERERAAAERRRRDRDALQNNNPQVQPLIVNVPMQPPIAPDRLLNIRIPNERAQPVPPPAQEIHWEDDLLNEARVFAALDNGEEE